MFVVANVAVFVAAICVARFLGRFSFEPTRDNPLFGPSSSTLEKMGAVEWEKIVKRHQGWRMVTCIWLHAGVIHLVANMLCAVRVGIIYLVSGFGGSVLSSLFIRSGISVGASGALFGLLGAMLSELLTNWTIYSNKAAAMITLLVIIAVNLAIGILPHVDNFAHIGGFLTGFLLGFILLPRPQFSWMERRNLPSGVRLKSKYKPYQYVLWVISLALLISGFAVALVMLFRGVNGHEKCHWCKYLSCVPTSKWECDDF
ncbi:RHOMBOID-like protein 3 [Linum perenne]